MHLKNVKHKKNEQRNDKTLIKYVALCGDYKHSFIWLDLKNGTYCARQSNGKQ